MAGPYKKLCTRDDSWVVVDGENERLAEVDTELLADLVMHWLVTQQSPPPDYIAEQEYHTEVPKPAESEGIKKTFGVMGGDACIRDTRIAVWQIIDMKNQGFSNTDILSNFRHLTYDDIFNAMDYYRGNREEVDRVLKEHNNGDS